MTSPCPFRRVVHGTSTALLFLLLANGAAASDPSASVPAALAPRLAAGIAHDQLLWDEPGDASIWARGSNYKASFDASGAKYYPAFGSRAPRNVSHSLSPDSLIVGGTSIPFVRDALAVRSGDQVRIDRGAFVEVYDVEAGSMEQSFVFESLPGAGDLVLHIPIASELSSRETAAGFEFHGELGRVTYSRAIAFDARGRQLPASTSLSDGSITIRMNAADLEQAALPLIIDPVVGTIPIPGGSTDDYSADVSFDETTQRWLVVWEEYYSATDTDVYCRTFTSAGTPVASATIDFTIDAWKDPRCANNAAANQFLVVAGVTSGSVKSIKGRTATPNGAGITMGAQFQISGADAGDKTSPDVGGDSYTLGTTNYCVAFTHAHGNGYTQIGVAIVLPSSTVGHAYYLPGAGGVFGADDSQPSVAKTTGGNFWLLAWRHAVNVENGDIHAVHLDYLGFPTEAPFAITPGTPQAEHNPCASSPLTDSDRAVVTYQTSLSGSSNRDIHVAALQGSTVLQIANLNTLEGTGFNARDQIEPSVDCDGRHFLVAYSEFDPSFVHYNVFASDLYLAGSQIGLRQSHVLVQGFGLSERRANVAASHGTGTWSGRYGVVYDFEQNTTDHDVFGNLFDVLDGGTVAPFCLGDGSGTACPCGNFGGIGRGCANSVDGNGARLELASGVPSTVSDDVVLRVIGVPTSAACLFFQGTSQLTGVAFGDGLRCAGGTIVRIGTKTASGGVATYPQAGGDASVSIRGGIAVDGGRYAYQVWYRNAAAYCTSATYNLSNGLRIDWAR